MNENVSVRDDLNWLLKVTFIKMFRALGSFSNDSELAVIQWCRYAIYATSGYSNSPLVSYHVHIHVVSMSMLILTDDFLGFKSPDLQVA